VTTPAKLADDEYIAFLDSLPVHPSCLYFASQDANVEKVKEILLNNPKLDVNWIYLDENRRTALHVACEKGCDPIVSILVAHPDIDVSLKDSFGWTPFSLACFSGNASCVRVLLEDARVKVNETDYSGYTPLRWAARNAYLDVIKCWIASGRDLYLDQPENSGKKAIEEAKEWSLTEVVTLLESFRENSKETKHAVRVEIGWFDSASAEMFALVVFLSDGLLSANDTTPTPAARFFRIARRLPLELQMVLCYLHIGSSKEIIPRKDSEEAFKSLARRLL